MVKSKNMKKFSISVIGLGFVGLTLAVVNAKNGFKTVAIDVDANKIRNCKLGKPYFYEPLLKNYLLESIKTNKIQFTDNFNDVLKTDIIFITVGTPSSKDGKIDLSNLKKVVTKLAKTLKNKRTKHLIVIKSTVIPTTTSHLVSKAFCSLKNVGIVVNPEFLREGSAIRDLLNPHLLVIGSNKKQDEKKLEQYFKMFYKKKHEILRTNFTTAELIKYANNAFLATKLSFINSIANICQSLPNTDVDTIAKAIGKDSRIGPLFLKAGPGFGGSCLPKDLNALIKFSEKFDNVNTLFVAVKDVNESQPLRIVSLMKKMQILGSKKIVSILGLSFKKDTDDIREAISVKLVSHLVKRGLKIRVHDPVAISNFKKIFGQKISYFKNISQCLEGSHCCIILTDWDEYKLLKPSDFKKMKKINIIDARRILDPKSFSKFNFKAIGLGNEYVRT